MSRVTAWPVPDEEVMERNEVDAATSNGDQHIYCVKLPTATVEYTAPFCLSLEAVDEYDISKCVLCMPYPAG